MVGDRIKILRLFKEMTQDELVEGIASVAYLSKVENGQARPSEPFLAKIVERLELDVALLANTSFYSDLEERVHLIFDHYWHRKILSDQDICLIKLLSTELQSTNISLMVFSVLIRYFYSQSRLVEAKETYQLSKKVVNQDGAEWNREYGYYYLFACGVLQFELYEFHLARQYFLQAELYLPDDYRQRARVYYNLSLINEKINPDKIQAIDYSEKAYHYMKLAGDHNRTVNILLVRAIQFYSIGDTDQALDCVAEAESLVSLADSDPRLKSSIIYSFGRIHQLKGNHQEASRYFNEYIAIVEDLFPEKVIKGYKRLAEIGIHSKEWDAVTKYLYLAQDLAAKYKKVFFDKEVKLLEIMTYKIKQQYDKYEKEMQRLLVHCIEQHDDEWGKFLATELAVYFHHLQAYKKSATLFKQAYDIEKRLGKGTLVLFDGYPFEF
jgi:HTH-type transcriptional regulator, quorum sensing regulator NprR